VAEQQVGQISLQESRRFGGIGRGRVGGVSSRISHKAGKESHLLVDPVMAVARPATSFQVEH
jgi:hypothetical protein